MSRASRSFPCRGPHLVAVLGLAAAGLPQVAAAQADSTTSALRLAVAAGPTLAARTAGAPRLGYAIQGVVALVLRPGSRWRLGGDVLYQHVGAAGRDMRASGDGSYRMQGDPETSTAALVGAVFAGRRAKAVVPYLVGGLGVGWVSAMNGATDKTTTGEMDAGRGAARLVTQGGGGSNGIVGAAP